MKEVVCGVCNGHKEVVIPVMEVQPDGTPRLIYKRFTCTACNGAGVRYVQEEKK